VIKKTLKQLLHLDYPKLIPLWIAVFVDILGFSVLIPFLPYFSEEYGAPDWQVGLLLSTNALFSFFSGPMWGRLSDRYGRKPMLLLSQMGTLAGFLMLAFSKGMPMLYASRVVDGIFGGNFPIAKAVIGDIVPPKERSKHMSNIGTAHVMSSLIGPAIGGLLSDWGIIAPGLFSVALTCVTIGVTFLYLDETRASDKHTTQDINLFASQGRGVWRNPTARYLLVQWGFHTLSFIIYVSCISLFAKAQLNLDAKEIGLMLMASGVVRLLVRFTIFVPLLDKFGDRKTSLLGLASFVIVFFLLGFVQNPFQFVLVMSGASFAAACTRGVLTGSLSRTVKPWEQGQAMGLSASLDSFAQITGPIIGAIALDYLPTWVYGSTASALALIALLMGFKRLECHDTAETH
jgi:DHA1 family tetracycline resistance protein-like MFS transporter